MPEGSAASIPPALQRAYRIIIFDWDGTAVPDRKTPMPALDRVLERLLSAGVYIAPVTGTNVDNLERQSLLNITPAVRRGLFVCTNRGSEVFSYAPDGTRESRHLRRASDAENRALTTGAEALQRTLQERGLDTQITYDRLNRRKVDLIPLPERSAPPKAIITQLIAATNARLAGAGYDGIGEVIRLAASLAKTAGVEDPRITSDGKYMELGLTDKSDSVRWLLANVAKPNSIAADEILIAGDEFGSIGGITGSDERMALPELPSAPVVSVGAEPNGARQTRSRHRLHDNAQPVPFRTTAPMKAQVGSANGDPPSAMGSTCFSAAVASPVSTASSHSTVTFTLSRVMSTPNSLNSSTTTNREERFSVGLWGTHVVQMRIPILCRVQVYRL